MGFGDGFSGGGGGAVDLGSPGTIGATTPPDIFAANLKVFGSASITLLETVNQQSLLIGDKYITMSTGSVDHLTLDGSGILYGSGSTGPTVDALGANAHVLYRAASDSLEIFPNLTVTGNGSVTGNLSVTGSILSQKISGSLTKLTDGTSYIIAGNNLSVTTGSSGAVTVGTTFGTGTNGQVLTMTGGSPGWSNPSGGGLKLSVASKTDLTSTAWTTIGAFTQNWPSPAQYTSWTFSAIASAPSGYTVEVRIYNQTSAALVTNSTVSTTALIPTALTSSALTIPADNSTPLYLVQMRIASGSPTPSDIATVYGAYITLS